MKKTVLSANNLSPANSMVGLKMINQHDNSNKSVIEESRF